MNQNDHVIYEFQQGKILKESFWRSIESSDRWAHNLMANLQLNNNFLLVGHADQGLTVSSIYLSIDADKLHYS